MKELIKRIMEARKEAVRSGIYANMLLLNDKLGITKSFEIDGYVFPPMVCGMEVKVTDELPDNVSFAITRTAQTERDKIIAETQKRVAQEFCYRFEQCGMDYGKVMSVLEKLGDKYGVEKNN